jgi:cytochrome bd-type quinol oxidase subunit 2
MKTLANVVAAIYVVAVLVVRFRNPTLTETQMFMHPVTWIGAPVTFVLMCAILWPRKQNTQ